tara:strand:+ start:34 stop:393 length:360 start_codon:yes stop_codon:yes gene_type:complete
MKDLKGVEKYSEEYDLIMDLEMQVVANAYDTEGYSIKLPNDITGMSIKRSFDGDCPVYKEVAWKVDLDCLGLRYDSTIADYPRHGNTLRIFYKDIEKAYSSLYFLRQFVIGKKLLSEET